MLRDTNFPQRNLWQSTRQPLFATVHGLLVLVIAGISLLPILQFLSVAVERVRYPFELEWMEGAIVDHVRLVLEGEPLYRKPSLQFTPFIYVPGYYYVSAIAMKLVGTGLLGPRLISLIATLGCIVTIGAWIYKETKRPLASLVSIGCFVGTYGLSEYWFDIARGDSLFLLFVLLGYMFARFGNRPAHAIVCGALLAAATLTKQTAMVLAIAALVFTLVRSTRFGIVATSTYVTLVGCCMGALQLASNGWFGFYAFTLPSEHAILWKSWHVVLAEHFIKPAYPMLFCAIATIAGFATKKGSRVWAFYVTWTLASSSTAFFALLHSGGYPNVLMCFHAALAIASGLVFAVLFDAAEPASWQRLLRRIVAFVLVAQAWHVAPPIRRSALVPSFVDEQCGKALLATVSQFPQPVWMVSSGYYPWLSHHAGVTAHAMALTDVFKSRQKPIKQQLLSEIVEQLDRKRFSAIVLDRATGFLPLAVGDAIRRNYQLAKVLEEPNDPRFWPKSGAYVRPDELWLPAPQ